VKPHKTLLAIIVGVYLLGFGILVGVVLDRMRFDVQRTAVLTRYEQALREWKTDRMAFEKDAASIRQESRRVRVAHDESSALTRSH
jgi:hypothetical protein